MNYHLLCIFLCTASIAQAALPAHSPIPQEIVITFPPASIMAEKLKPEFPEFVTTLKLDTLLGSRKMISSHVLGEVEGQFLKLKPSLCVLEVWQKNRARVMKILLSDYPQEYKLLNAVNVWE